MQESSICRDLMSEQQYQQVRSLILETEIIPFSCLFWRMDIKKVIQANRVLSDDFIYIPVKGSIAMQIGKRTETIRCGDVAMVPTGMVHGAQLAPDANYLEVYALHLHAVDKQQNAVFRMLATPFGKLNEPALWHSWLGVCTHLMGRDLEAGSDYMSRLVKDLIVEQITHGAVLKQHPEKLDPRISRILGYVRQNLGEDICIEDLASNVGLSAGRFRVLFKQAVDMSPKQYLKRVRLSRARVLLKTESNLTVRQIASMVGYKYVHKFHSAYRETFGETPKESSK